MSTREELADYTIAPYRYSKGTVVVRPTKNGSGWKTRADRLADGIKGRWSHRAKGYVMTPAKAAKFERLYSEGWDASPFTARLIEPEKETV